MGQSLGNTSPVPRSRAIASSPLDLDASPEVDDVTLGPVIIDEQGGRLLAGAGRIFDEFSSAIEHDWRLKYTLIGLNIATGPVSFGVVSGIQASPVGHYINTEAARSTEYVADRFGAAGYESADSTYAGVAATSFAGLVLGVASYKAAVGIIKSAASAVPNLLGRFFAKSVKENVGTRTIKLGDGAVEYGVDNAGLTLRAEGTISGPHVGRGKGTLLEPMGGRVAGEHRGHLIPEGGVDVQGYVNRAENLISEAPGSNLGLKKSFGLRASRIAAENPNSVVRFVSEPIRRVGESRPFAVSYYITVDGKVVEAVSILNK